MRSVRGPGQPPLGHRPFLVDERVTALPLLIHVTIASVDDHHGFRLAQPDTAVVQILGLPPIIEVIVPLFIQGQYGLTTMWLNAVRIILDSRV